jgi:alanine dehydrogenase
MTVQEKSNENSLISKAMLLPQEEMLEVKKRGQKIKIGIPSDFSKVEYRVPLTRRLLICWFRTATKF